MDRLGDPALRKPMGDRGRQRAAALDWPGHVAALRGLYQRSLALRDARDRPA